MSYESKLYVVEKSDLTFSDDCGKYYANLIAVFDMCCCPTVSGLTQKPTDCYIYADDSNTKIVEDQYGEPLYEINIGELIKALETTDSTHRRLKPLLAFLKVLDPKKWRELRVLHFGY